MPVALGLGLCFVALAAKPGPTPDAQGDFLYLIALGAWAAGAVVGFIYAATPTERPIFDKSLTVINGVIGGFAISDLTSNEGIIRRGLHALATAAGLPTSGGVAAMCVYFGALGFLSLYIGKQYLLNPILDEIARFNQNLAGLADLLPDAVMEYPHRDTDEPFVDDETKHLIQKALDQPDLIARVEVLARHSRSGRLLAQGTLSMLSKAYYILDQFPLALQANKAALGLDPENPELLFYRGNILAAYNRPVDAIAPLEYAIALRGEKAATYKLLGYCLLFQENSWQRALEMTEKYLALYPDDLGAKINKACAMGQRGPSKEGGPNSLIVYLESLFAQAPSARERIASLTEPGDDFAAWVEIPEFKRLVIGTGSGPQSSTG